VGGILIGIGFYGWCNEWNPTGWGATLCSGICLEAKAAYDYIQVERIKEAAFAAMRDYADAKNPVP